MTSQSIRMMKEARLLAWPFTGITLAALFSLMVHASGMTSVAPAVWHFIESGIFAGIPLLAAIALGAEFQYNTLGLALAQPLERSEYWQSKFNAIVLEVLPAAVLFVISRRLSPEFEQTYWLALIAWLVVTTASAFLF